MLVYDRPRTRVQSFYYDYMQRHGRGARLFNEAHEICSDYEANYLMPVGILRELQPFQFIRPGDVSVMVGIHDGFIDLGLSAAFTASAVAGPEGRTCVIDCDPRNVHAVERYSEQNGLTNVESVHRGVWDQPGEREFLFFEDFSSSNTIMPVADKNMDSWEKRWGQERLEKKSRKVLVDVDTLDSIVEERGLTNKVNFLNLTLNGAELNAAMGAREIIDSQSLRAIGFPLRPNTFPLVEMLAEKGFNITVSDASTKAWDPEPFIYACAVSISESDLFAQGFHHAETVLDDSARLGFVIHEAGGR